MVTNQSASRSPPDKLLNNPTSLDAVEGYEGT